MNQFGSKSKVNSIDDISYLGEEKGKKQGKIGWVKYPIMAGIAFLTGCATTDAPTPYTPTRQLLTSTTYISENGRESTLNLYAEDGRDAEKMVEIINNANIFYAELQSTPTNQVQPIFIGDQNFARQFSGYISDKENPNGLTVFSLDEAMQYSKTIEEALQTKKQRELGAIIAPYKDSVETPLIE